MKGVLLITVAAALSACGRIAGLDDVRSVPSDAETDAAIDTVPCTSTIQTPPSEGAAHADNGAAITWNANPPASGTHYNDWAVWDRVYPNPVPRGFLVHNLEHGGVVFLHNCTNCQADIDRMIAAAQSLPTDALCSTPVAHRTVVTPDPLLPAGVQFAAVAWGASYTSNCANETELRAFAVAHYDDPAQSEVEHGNCMPGQYTGL